METLHISKTDAEVKFETYRYYLQCFRDYLLSEYTDWKSFGRKAIHDTRRLQGMSECDERWLERFLKIAWNTEYLLSIGSDDPEFLRINNQWAPIQCYYAVYAATEACAYVLDGQKADGHKKALRKCTEYFVRRGLSPWNKAFCGPVGKSRQDQKSVNFPGDLLIPHNLRRQDVQPLEMIAKCLRAEHGHRVNDDWNRAAGRKYQFDPGRTGLLHFLYRLRIKSNYKEIDLFVSDAPEKKVRSFAESIEFLCFWNLLYMEIIILRRYRKKRLIALGMRYLELNQRADRLEERLKFYGAEV